MLEHTQNRHVVRAKSQGLATFAQHERVVQRPTGGLRLNVDCKLPHLQSFGVGAAAVGTTLSAYALARLMMNIPSGILGDTRGRKPLLVWGPAITAVGACLGLTIAVVCAAHVHIPGLGKPIRRTLLYMWRPALRNNSTSHGLYTYAAPWSASSVVWTAVAELSLAAV